MILKNKPTLLYDASVIRHETADYHNTAERVGAMFTDLINAIDGSFLGLEDLITETINAGLGNISITPDVDLTNYVTTSQLSTALQAYLPRVEFDEMFEKVYREDGTYYLRCKVDFLGVGEITAYGGNGNAGGDGNVPGAGATRLRFLEDVLLPEAGIADESVLTFDAQTGMWVAKQVKSGLDTSELAAYLQDHDYAKLSDIPALPDLSIYATEEWVNAKGYALASALDDYVTIATPQEVSGQKRFSQSILLGTADDYIELSYSGGAFRVNSNLVAAGEVTAYGSADFETFGGARRLDDLLDVTLGAVAVGDALVWDGTKWVNQPVSVSGGGGLDTAAGDARYVLKDGDMMTGALNINMPVEPIVRFYRDEVNKGSVGYYNGYMYLYNAAAAKSLRLYDDGSLKLGSNTIWHSGNDGENSGLDADMLDGVHVSAIFRRSLLSPQDLDANNLTSDFVCYTSNGDMNVWGNATFTNFPTSRPDGGFCLLNLKEGNYAKQLYTRYSDNHLYVRNRHYSGGANVWSGWSTVALTTDNVASATRLQTNSTYTAWGQTFFANGVPNSISGRWELNGVYSGSLSIFDGTDYRAIQSYGSKPLCLNPIGNNVAIGKTTAGYKLDVNGSIRSTSTIIATQKYQVDGTSAVNSYPEILFHIPNVNYTQIYMDGDGALHVKAGDNQSGAYKNMHAQEIHSHGWFRSYNAQGWFNETYGGGIYMTDTTYVRVSHNKSFYCPANILAAGEITAYSDERGKECIKPLENRGGVRPVTYIKDGKQSIGFIAQDAHKLYPELVHDDGTDEHWLSFNYMQYTAVLQVQIDDIKSDVERIKEKLGI